LVAADGCSTWNTPHSAAAKFARRDAEDPGVGGCWYPRRHPEAIDVLDPPGVVAQRLGHDLQVDEDLGGTLEHRVTRPPPTE
jgi:hypothetical protein